MFPRFLPKLKKHPSAGFAALFVLSLILTLTLLIVSSLSLLTITEQKIAANAAKSAQAYYAAESGIEDSLYRLIKNKNYSDDNNLSVGAGSAAITISSVGEQKNILIQGQQQERFRSLQVKLDTNSQGVSFYYGVQVGEGGLIMSNNSSVQGSIYSNGSIEGNAGATITGDAFVASAPSQANQTHELKNNDFVFGQSGNAIDTAQSFTPTISDKLLKISVYIKKIGSPADKTVRILTDNNNNPSKTLVSSNAYGTLQASKVSSNYGWVDISLNTSPDLQSGVKYWIAIDTSTNSSNYFAWGQDTTDSYAGGTGKYSPNWNASSPTWYASNSDFNFKAWLGGTINSLESLAVGGNAHANTIEHSQISGDAYYQNISDSTVGGIQYPGSSDPAPQDMPVSEQNIIDWKTGAEAGGIINGDYTLINGAIGSLGPKKIIGNLNLSNNADLTITGTLYVTGAINISNNAKLRLGANYDNSSGVVLTDGQISVSNNVVFYTNAADSYLLLLSTKSGTAISVSNNTNTVIFYASNGAVDISNNAILKEVTAYRISMSNGAQIIYESGLASVKFSSGVGGSWKITNWEEVP